MVVYASYSSPVFYSPSQDVIMLGAMDEVEGLRALQWFEADDGRMRIHVSEERAARTSDSLPYRVSLCGIVIPPVEALLEGCLWGGIAEPETCNKCRQEAAHWIKQQGKVVGRIGFFW